MKLGFALLLSVVCLWVGSSNLIQIIFDNINFNKPFFLTYFSTGIFMLYLIDVARIRNCAENEQHPDLMFTFKVASQFCPLWFLANYFYNLSLNLTSVSSSTILSSTSGLITLMLSIWVLRESPDFCKFFAALLSFAGVIIISIEDSSKETESIVGDFFALVSAVFYSLYCIFLSKYSQVVYLPHLFGFVGLVNVLFFWPFFGIFQCFGLEQFEVPSGTVWLFLFINALFGTFLSDLLWAFSIKLLNPVVCTLGITLTIPFSMIVDLFVNGKNFSFSYMLGGAMIIAGFVIISLFQHPVYSKILSNDGMRSLIFRKKYEDVDEKVEFASFTNSA